MRAGQMGRRKMSQQEMREVTKEAFFAAVGPMNVHPRSDRDRTVWETPARQLIGITTPGYMCEGPTTYRLFVAKAGA
jgi:hypothetical protein